MPYAAGNNCYATVAEAAQQHRWMMGHNTPHDVGGVAHLLQVTPTTDGNGTTMKWELYRSSDWTVVSEATLQYSPPTCGTLDPAQFGITGPVITKVVGWGFGVVLLGFLLGYVLSLALGLIKKV